MGNTAMQLLAIIKRARKALKAKRDLRARGQGRLIARVRLCGYSRWLMAPAKWDR